MTANSPSTSERDGQPAGGSVVYVALLTLVAALGGLLFGYDTAVISGAIGFLQTYFDLDPQLYKGWAAASALIGCAAGAALAGMLSDRLGRKKVLLISAVLFLISALGTAFPRNFIEFIVFRIVGGLGVGAASMTSPMYIAEIAPARIRGRMVSINQLAIVSGMLVVYFVNYFIAAYGTALDEQSVAEYVITHGPALEAEFVERFVVEQGLQIERDDVEAFVVGKGDNLDSQQVVAFLKEHEVLVDQTAVDLAARGARPWNVYRGWRWMFGSESIPAALLLILMFFVPESPRWLIKQNRRPEAMAVLTRVGGPKHADREAADIEATLSLETGSIAQLFEPGLRIVLVIGVALAILQQVTGINVFLYFAPEIFKKMGTGTDTALLQTVLVGAVNLTFTIIAIWTVDFWGRRPLMIAGASGMGVSLAALGTAAYTQTTELWVLVFILGYIACFALSVGPVTWVILSEIFPTKIRGRAMAIATVCLWLANYVVTQTFTYMDEHQGLVDMFHHAFPFWLYAALCVVQVLFVLRFVPETKGRTLEEIERGWLR